MTSITIAFGMPGIGEIAVVLAIVLVLFGGEKMPEFARNLGRAYRELRRYLNSWKHSDPEPPDPPDFKSPYHE